MKKKNLEEENLKKKFKNRINKIEEESNNFLKTKENEYNLKKRDR